MMQDVNTYEDYTFAVSDENWLKFCLFFNECVNECGTVNEEMHYFRLKLNRTPSSFAELLKDKQNWELYSENNTRYHKNNGYFKSSNPKYRSYSSYNNEYNMKFVDKNGLNEVIVSPKHDLRGMSHDDIYKELNNAYNLVILTADPNNDDENFRYDPVNVGTYNYYASLPSYGSIKGKIASLIHKQYDVSPFYEWGNVKGLPYGNSVDERDANGDFYTHTANRKVFNDWSIFINEPYN